MKVKTNSNETYIFDRLQKNENLIYAYAKKKSGTSEKLTDNGLEGEIDGKYLKVLFSEETIKEYHSENKVLSIILKVAIPVLILGVAVLLAYSSVKAGI